jgi:DNA modification methylase
VGRRPTAAEGVPRPVTPGAGSADPVRRPTVPARRPTITARFGSSRRESHDASGFYDRFVPPEISTDATVVPPIELDVIHAQSATEMTMVATGSVALVVTSPPYFAGKAYEESLGANGVPGSYFEYLELLRQVFGECKRVLEPGGRLAVNVANLGRRPYRSLAGDVTTILQDLGLLLRGEVIWWKGRAAGGSCAWGTFQRPANPVLRDVTERIVIASKGRFDRAGTPGQRLEAGRPSTATISREEFLEATTDLWELPPESATRVGHPAPFPVELPTRLIDLYTYRDDLVLDPFMGSGTTAVAALRTGRHFVGFDTDEGYVLLAKERVEAERIRLGAPGGTDPTRTEIAAGPADPVPADVGPADVGPADVGPADVGPAQVGPAEVGPADVVAAAVRQGRAARDVAALLLGVCGFHDIRQRVKPRGTGLEVALTARGDDGGLWAFDVSGAFSVARSGLRRRDTLWRAVGAAAVLHQALPDVPLVLLTTDVPARGSAGAQALSTLTGPNRPVFDVIRLLDPVGRVTLAGYASGRPEAAST